MNQGQKLSSETNDAAMVAIETNRANIEDLDYAEAISRFNQGSSTP